MIGIYILQILLFVSLPALAIWLAKQHKVLSLLGAVVLCYLFGMLLATICDAFVDGFAYLLSINSDSSLVQTTHATTSKVSEKVMEGSIPLAIPLLLFGVSLRQWLGQSKNMLLSFGLAVISVMVVGIIAHMVFATLHRSSADAVGMLAGMYTGGSVSMAAVKLSLDSPQELFAALQASDMLVGGLYLLFLLSAARPVFGWVLKPFPEAKTVAQQMPQQETQILPLFAGKGWLQMLFALSLAAGIVMIAVGISVLLYGKLDIPIIMLLLTLLALAASMSSRIRSIPNTYATGYYLMLIFCVALGSLVDLKLIVDSLDPFFALVACMMLGSIALHLLLAVLFKIDRDTFIITSTAAIYGPPFIPSVANAIRNPAMVLPGLVTGLMGYAIAHNLGVLMVKFLAWLA